MPDRIKMKKRLVRIDESPDFKVIHPNEVDKVDIASVMYEAYKDTVDYEDDTIDDLVMDILNIERGLYGKYLPEASFLAIFKQRVIGGIFLCDFKNEATITYNFTQKKYRNMGVSSTLIQLAENVLFDKGYDDIHLYVSLENQSAFNLYQSLGFEKEEIETEII